jgi:light-regulated signal transduction histidine kinase (bacteriophytochrome)
VKALLRLRSVERELSATNERLRLVNQELERSNEDLKQFAFAASHDLQEPLRTVAGFAALLDRAAGVRLAENERVYLKHIVEGALRMRTLIDDLLAYSQVGHKPDPLQVTDLNTVLAWALENLHESIALSEGQVTADPLPSVVGDEAQLGQVLQNLISNGLKYTRAGVKPVVHLSARREGHNWIIEVADNGIGIGSEDRQHIFQAFKRLHGRDIPGTGIGLALCRRVVEAHGGRIWVEPNTNEGSRFLFTLPAIES